MVRDFAILGHFKLDLFLQSAITGRLHINLSAELLFFLGEIAPLGVVFEVLSTPLILAHPLLLLRVLAALAAAGRAEGALLVADDPQCVLHLLYLGEG